MSASIILELEVYQKCLKEKNIKQAYFDGVVKVKLKALLDCNDEPSSKITAVKKLEKLKIISEDEMQDKIGELLTRHGVSARGTCDMSHGTSTVKCTQIH
jgi:hypothetical protein